MPTAVPGNFPQPEVSEDPPPKPSSQNHCQINTAEHQTVAAYSQALDVWNQQCHLKLIPVSAEFPGFPLAPSAFIPLRFYFCLWAFSSTQWWWLVRENWCLLRTEWANTELIQNSVLLGRNTWGHKVTYCSVCLPSFFIHLKEYQFWKGRGKDVLLRVTQWSYERTNTIPVATIAALPGGLLSPSSAFWRILQFIPAVALKVF